MFFFFAGGIENQVRQVLKTGAAKCINCRSPSDLVEYDKVLKLFLVPVWRWPGKDQLMHCNNCNLFFPPSLSRLPPREDVDLRCQVCGRGVGSDFRFCPFCGSSL